MFAVVELPYELFVTGVNMMITKRANRPFKLVSKYQPTGDQPQAIGRSSL